MLRQILKMIWRRRRGYAWIYLEQVFLFIVLAYCTVQTLDALRRIYSPGALDIENVVAIGLPYGASNSDLEQKAYAFINAIKQNQDVVSISKTINFAPYIGECSSYDSLTVDGTKCKLKVRYTDENAYQIFHPVLEEGNWLTDAARPDGSYPAVVTRQLADELNWTSAEGKQIIFEQQHYVIVGVIEGLKEDPLIESPASLILPIKAAIRNTDIPFYVAKVQEGRKNDFYSSIEKEYSKIYSGTELDWIYSSLDVIKDARLYGMHFILIIMILICGFLIVYTFIGIYGVVSLYSERRMREYALQLALGLTPKVLFCKVIFENIMVTIGAIVPGVIVLLYIVDFSEIENVVAVVLAVILMILFSLLSAWLPALRVSKQNPAEVLMIE